MGLLTNEDAKIFRGWFEEMASLHGISVGYQYPLGDTKTIHSEPNMAMSNPIQLDIIFNENPTLDTLKKHGWVTEIGEQKPVVAQVPYETPKLQRYSRIIIPPIGTIIDSRTFEVTAISTIMEYPDCWTIRLAPVYKTIQEEHQVLDDGNVSMIDVDSKGSLDSLKGRNKELADYKFPEGEIEFTIKEPNELFEEVKSEDRTEESSNVDNVLGKNFNEFDD